MVHHAWIFNAVLTLLALGFGLSGPEPDPPHSAFTLPGPAYWMWAPVGVLCLAFTAWQTLPRLREHALLARLGAAPGIAFLSASLWSREERVHWAVALAGMAATLLAIAYVLATLIRSAPARDREEHWLLDWPLTLFCGWVLVNCAVNATRELQIVSTAWNLSMVLLLSTLGWALSRFTRLRPGFSLGLAWGLGWIAAGYLPQPHGLLAALGAAETVFAGTFKSAKRLA